MLNRTSGTNGEWSQFSHSRTLNQQVYPRCDLRHCRRKGLVRRGDGRGQKERHALTRPDKRARGARSKWKPYQTRPAPPSHRLVAPVGIEVLIPSSKPTLAETTAVTVHCTLPQCSELLMYSVRSDFGVCLERLRAKSQKDDDLGGSAG